MRIIIPGNPIAKARPKFAVRGKHAMAYDSQNHIKAFAKKDLSFRLEEWFIVNEHARSRFKASFSDQKKVTLAFHVPFALSDSIAKRKQKLWLPDFGEWHSKKDIDNFVKWSLDIANEILWHDDSQIVELHALQKYSENPCTIIEIEDIKINMNENAIRMTSIFSPSALEKLESDLSVLSANLESLRLCQREDRQEHMECAAGTLKLFANTYSLALKKMLAK